MLCHAINASETIQFHWFQTIMQRRCQKLLCNSCWYSPRPRMAQQVFRFGGFFFFSRAIRLVGTAFPPKIISWKLHFEFARIKMSLLIINLVGFSSVFWQKACLDDDFSPTFYTNSHSLSNTKATENNRQRWVMSGLSNMWRRLVKMWRSCCCFGTGRVRGGRALPNNDRRGERKMDEWRGREAMQRRGVRERGNGSRGAASNLGLLMILPEGHRQCRHGWVEYILTPYCVEHLQIGRAVWNKINKKSFASISVVEIRRGENRHAGSDMQISS